MEIDIQDGPTVSPLMSIHPHTNCSGDIVVVHNGIIENYMSIKNILIEKGYVFRSETIRKYLLCGLLL